MDKKSAAGIIVAVIFWGAFLSGGIFGLHTGIKAASLAKASRSWPSSQGRILSSEIGKRRSQGKKHGRRTIYSAKIEYEYYVNGITYISKRVSFGDYGSSNPAHARSIIARYPSNSTVTVYFNPENPIVSVLEQGGGGGIHIPFMVGIIFSLAGSIGLVSTFRKAMSYGKIQGYILP